MFRAELLNIQRGHEGTTVFHYKFKAYAFPGKAGCQGNELI